MKKIMLQKIIFENYRQYGTSEMDFQHQNQYNLSAIVAKNGTGKTTFLNAITWCLYGKEYHLSSGMTALPILNTDVERAMDVGEEKSVKVKIIMLDGDKKVEIERTQRFVKQKDILTGKENIKSLDNEGDLKVIIINQGDVLNPVLYDGSGAELVIKQYFDQEIYNFYFFDGEKLSEFFDNEKQSLKESIYNIAQVTLLSHTISHIEKKYTDSKRKAYDNSPRLQSLYDKEQGQKDIIDNLLGQITSTEDENTSYANEKKDKERTLRSIEPTMNLQKQRDKAIEELNEVRKKQEENNEKIRKFIFDYTFLLKLYPTVKTLYEIICDKEKKGELPSSINKRHIELLLADTSKRCPVCDKHIDADAIKHLQELLRLDQITTETSHCLATLKPSLEKFIEEAKRYKEKKRALDIVKNELSKQENDLVSEIQDKGRLLANVDIDFDGINPAVLEKRIEELENRIRDNNISIGSYKTSKKIAEDRLNSLQSDIKILEREQSNLLKNVKQKDVYENALQQLKSVKDTIMLEMRSEVEATTWKYFDRMIWKEKTFGSIAIDDNYKIKVYDTEGREMTGSLSATEHMALAYAFTLAIHEASGVNAPLIIDSPLGRVSDINREKMADALLQVSEEKQIIMLFTPDEYSAAVEEIYAGKATVRHYALSADEKYVERVN